jgi:hypothetical protein
MKNLLAISLLLLAFSASAAPQSICKIKVFTQTAVEGFDEPEYLPGTYGKTKNPFYSLNEQEYAVTWKDMFVPKSKTIDKGLSLTQCLEKATKHQTEISSTWQPLDYGLKVVYVYKNKELGLNVKGSIRQLNQNYIER